MTVKEFLSLYDTNNIKYLKLGIHDSNNQVIAELSDFNSLSDLSNYFSSLLEKYKVKSFLIICNEQQQAFLTIRVNKIESED